jgi:cyclophilin family peptidyl-prolyl cis-trans isomerase
VAEAAGAQARRLRARLPLLEAEEAARRADESDPALPRVEVQTVHGRFVVLLHARDVPTSTEHFLSLVRERVYDGTLFHSVKGEGRALGGDPLSRDEGCEAAGAGTGPRTIPAEENPRHGFFRGAVGLARRVKPECGCQFFVLTSPPPEPYDRPTTCLGHVVSGMEVVDRLEQCDEIVRVVVLPPAPGPR